MANTFKNSEVDKKAKTFYVVCADPSHIGGWCSTAYDNYDAADKALSDHRDQTGHTDNNIQNDCPFGKS